MLVDLIESTDELVDFFILSTVAAAFRLKTTIVWFEWVNRLNTLKIMRCCKVEGNLRCKVVMLSTAGEDFRWICWRTSLWNWEQNRNWNFGWICQIYDNLISFFHTLLTSSWSGSLALDVWLILLLSAVMIDFNTIGDSMAKLFVVVLFVIDEVFSRRRALFLRSASRLWDILSICFENSSHRCSSASMFCFKL